MNRNTRTAAKIAGIIVATVICSVLAYYVSSAVAGHQLTNATSNMNYSRWQEKFLSLTIAAGVFTGVCSLLWFILARWAFKINTATGTGKRTIWGILAAVSLVGSIAIPQIYSASLGIKINGIVIALFILFFTVIDYWLLSIFTTPKSFKYTPVGAQLFIKG